MLSLTKCNRSALLGPNRLLLWPQVLQILSILPMVEIVAYMLAFGVGVGTVPWLLLGELCPVQVISGRFLKTEFELRRIQSSSSARPM
jgi:hypothetical protein